MNPSLFLKVKGRAAVEGAKGALVMGAAVEEAGVGGAEVEGAEGARVRKAAVEGSEGA